MTQSRTTTQEVPACPWGSKTDTPCRQPVTVERPHYYPAGTKVCTFHAALEPMREEIEDLNLALELLGEWEETARMHHNGPLIALLRRAREEFSGRDADARALFEGEDEACK